MKPFALTAAIATAAVLMSLHPVVPVHASPDRKQLGAALFHERGCEHCHGPNGTGGELGPDLSTIGKRWKKPQIEHQIHDGGGGMPAFADALQPDEITALVEFLHTKKKAPKEKAVTPPGSHQTAVPTHLLLHKALR